MHRLLQTLSSPTTGVLLLGVASACAGPVVEYTPGQVWTYSTRPGEDHSRVVILRAVHDEKEGEAFDVRISGPLGHDEPVMPDIPVVRMTRAALTMSVVQCADQIEVPATWLQGAATRTFTTSVADAVTTIDRKQRERRGKPVQDDPDRDFPIPPATGKSGEKPASAGPKKR